ncbi:MAG: aspartate-semialdehyde dehydrogenase [Acetomicrobium sp.]
MRVAVLGATGLVGQEIIKVLEERNFPISDFVPLASSKSAGKVVEFSGAQVEVREVADDAFKGVDIALFAAGAGVSKRWARVAVSKGAVVIDNSSAWRLDPEIPLIVPEVNPEDVMRHNGIIANPNCATIQAVVALAPLHKRYCLEYFSAVTFQSVSGTGKQALVELDECARAILEGKSFEPQVYPLPIGFNVLPHIGAMDESGVSDEEWKMLNESRKILHHQKLQVSCTTVRVPVKRGHSEAIVAQFEERVTLEEANAILSEAPGIIVMAENKYITPLQAAGSDLVYVCRLRSDLGMSRALSMWVVSDNLRKGAALNAVQIAELVASKTKAF